MKFLIRVVFGTIICLSLTRGYSQDFKPLQSANAIKHNSKELSVGDRIPDFVFTEVMNYHALSAKISDFKSELTIFDLWSTSCSSCVALFPHMEDLSKKYRGKVNIVLVNSRTRIWHDNKAKIRALLTTQQARTGKKIDLPIVFNASQFDGAFPAQTLPQEVWVKAGKIIGITGAEEVNEKNIDAILAGQNVDLRTKHDVMFNIEKTTLQQWYYGSNGEDHNVGYSAILIKGFIDGLHGNGVRRAPGTRSNKITGWFYTCAMPFYLIAAAYSEQMGQGANTVLVETKDKSQFTKLSDMETLYKYAYSYDITVPETEFSTVMTYVQQDLCRAFKISVDTTHKVIPCLQIEKTDEVKLPAPNEKEYWPDKIDTNRLITNYPVNSIIDNLNQTSEMPLIDQTGTLGNVDFRLPKELNDTQSVILALQNNGFKVTRVNRSMHVLVIKDK